jgi:diguanylate cyclase (GGDEF)-like protein/PAS domain S-box-containing protein
MKKKRERPLSAAELRREAEMKLGARAKKAALPPSTEADSRRLVHELEVHQIELEMQNEELRRVQEELEESRAKYFDLYDLAPVGYLLLGEQGLILEANLTAARLLGMEKAQLVKKAVTRFIVREDQDIYYLHYKKLLETREPQLCELRMAGKSGSPFWVQLDANLVRDAAGGAPLCRVGMSDIAALKHVEEESSRAKASVEEANRELQQVLAREQELARTDALTGIHNRRYWFELAEHEFDIAARYRQPLSVIMFDVDHFKLVNDRFGHAVGDQMLERVAHVARAALRSSDAIGRYGGEECVIVLPMTTAAQAYPVAERIREGVAAIRISAPDGDAAVTLSIGVAEMILAPAGARLGGDASIEDVSQRADETMYVAKQSGGNRIATWSAPRPVPEETSRSRMSSAESGGRQEGL